MAAEPIIINERQASLRPLSIDGPLQHASITRWDILSPLRRSSGVFQRQPRRSSVPHPTKDLELAAVVFVEDGGILGVMPDAEAQLKQESGLVAMTAGGNTVPLATLVSAGLPEQLLLTLQQSSQDDGMQQQQQQQMTAVGIPGLGHHHHHQLTPAMPMPQFILAGGQLVQGIQGAQLLIPTSSGMATQHILTIPVNQAPSNQTVQMLTANGQIVTASLANLQALSSSPQMLTISSPHQQLYTQPMVPVFPTAPAPAHPPPQQQQQAPVALDDRVTCCKGQTDTCRSQAPQAVTSTSSADEAPVKGPYPGTNATISQTDANTVDGINLEEIKEFAKAFKMRRLSLGLTQTQVGQALSVTEGPAYSQSAICRFEKLDITPKSAQKIKPVLERWMKEAEERYRDGAQNLTDFMGSEPSKKRKRRTSFTPQALEILNGHFERSTHPSGAEMTELAEKLNYDREVVRVWFCNKRQALKNTIKKLKTQ